LKRHQSVDPQVDQFIIEIVESKHPSDVEKLTELVQERFSLPKQRIVEHILHLQSERRIALKDMPSQTPRKFGHFLRNSQSYWYWVTILLATITTIIVFTVPENAYPLVYARYVLGSIFVLWLPGYTFIKALFPTKVPIQTSSTELDTIERIALSIGMSIALVPIVGLLLNYTPWGIRLTPIVLSLLALTIVLATTAIIREYQATMKVEK